MVFLLNIRFDSVFNAFIDLSVLSFDRTVDENVVIVCSKYCPLEGILVRPYRRILR